MPGTKEYEVFLEKATKNPDSLEGAIVKQMYDKAAEETASQVRALLHQMIELAPGRLFRDVRLFHEKFGLEPTKDPGHRLPDDVLAFRVGFLQEELDEYAEALGCNYVGKLTENSRFNPQKFDAEKALDSLIDLVYVALGTAYLHGFDKFDKAWERVHEANMAKVRSSGADDERSARKHKTDVVKPEGWKPPVLGDLL